jgi:diaminopimelate epimerase
MSAIPFTKMHGAGNDFVVIDLRSAALDLSDDKLAAIADRHKGVGCDQVVLIESARNGADIRLRFYNADGSEAGACGNGTRCAASKVMQDEARRTLSIETATALLQAEKSKTGAVTVNMGPARIEWTGIPLARDVDTLHLPIAIGPVADPAAVGMGNPHCVFFVEDAEAIEVDSIGPIVERHELFPERTNVEFASSLPDGRLRMRVWERGVGITLACGSGVCAVAVAAVRRGLLSGRTAEVVADGGTLAATWQEDGTVMLTGPVATSFRGTFDD